ncbi:MAG: signal recognition particle-docking protein FtsY [Eubacteriales bacterium]|nr:signal recognition particle-docking protein FtsY [Clostridium sp.]MDY6088839.1 signal recognition particle-docking protein FtsY [Eubacteriales bacterium]
MWNIFKRKDKRKDYSANNEAVNAPEEPIEEQEPENPDPADEATQAEVEREAVQAAAFEETEKADPAEEREKAETEVPTPEAAERPVKAPAKKQSIFSKLFSGLKATRDTIFGGLFVENGEKINDEFYDELEEAMIISDMGMATAEKLLSQLRKELKAQGINTRTEARKVMIKLLAEAMKPETEFLPNADNAVIMIVGVNGVGKTTSIGKLASMYKAEGKSVMLAAADTFRAAAAEQLTVWAERADVPIVKHGEGADPAAVVFDSIASFKAKKCNLLICDTAGRLHNKVNLMNELSKMRRVISRELPDAPVEVLLVLDATTGQNAIAQAKAFGENAGLTGIILTKLDGTAKGGVVVAVKDELGLPVRFVGVGEGIDDLQPFDAETFAEALI